MIFRLIATLWLGLLLVFVGIVLKNSIKSQWARYVFWKRSKGLPIYDKCSLICNHAVSWLEKDTCNRVFKFYNQDGLKTRGYLMDSRPAVLTIDLDLIKTIVLDEPTKHINKVHLNLSFNEVIKDNLMLSKDDQWRRLRRAFSQALKPSQFKTPNVIAEINDSINKLINAIENKLDEAYANGKTGAIDVNVDELCDRYALNLVFSSFYKQNDLVNFGGPCYWADSVKELMESVASSKLVKLGLALPELQPIIDWVITNFHSSGKFRLKVIEFIKIQSKRALEARKQSAAQRKTRVENSENKSIGSELAEQSVTMNDGQEYKRNMIDVVIDQYLDGKITRSEYINSSVFLINAANLTSDDTILHTLYVLSINQDVQDKLRASIRADGEASQYLTWVINESLRLRPPAPIGSSRTITRDIPIDGGRYILPAGTFVTTPSYCIHRLKEYWGEDADEFKPDRWRDTSHHHPLQFIPFGAGARRCPGEQYALFEMKKLFVSLLTRYKFEGDINNEAYIFTTPFLIYLLTDEPFRIRIKRL